MHNKILNLKESINIANKLNNQGKRIVLVGGCFDLLHVGHILFFEESKKQGDILMVALESDESVKKMKGDERPINTQKDRATVLSAITLIDYVVLLPYLKTNQEYDEFVKSIKPAIIATTKGDPGRIHKERQAALVDAKVIDVISRIPNSSSSRLAKLLEKKLFI